MSTTPTNPSLNPQEIRQILDALEQSEWDQAVVTVGDVSISLSRNGASLASAAPAAPAAAPSAGPVAAAPASVPSTALPVEEALPVAAAAATGAGEGVPVLSPTVGIFWRCPEPGAQPFVEVGQQVRAGDIVCIVEVMKLMNNVTAPVSGTVSGIAVENAASVEFDQVLVTIAPEGT